MSATDGPLELTALGLAGAALKVGYSSGQGGESVYEPDLIHVGPQGMFLQWPDPPANLKTVRLEWSNNPFMPQTFRCECTVIEKQPHGLEVEFDRPAPAALQDWFAGMTVSLNRREPDAALRASKLYTSATVVSACGLLCGALAIILPILVGDRWWVDTLSKFLLVLMVASIGGFAWIRALAGREEVRAIGQSRG
ncbi:hypothetical protein MYX65_09530 [Acidobacteria bacterium AH-259-L09]|nr:hypothetical protein [Acidobacteria bacterium AH-259-L09]